MEKVKIGVAVGAAVLFVAAAMPGLVLVVEGVLRSPAEAATGVLLTLAGVAAVAYVATGLANVVAWHRQGLMAGGRWVRRVVVGFASATVAGTTLLLVTNAGF